MKYALNLTEDGRILSATYETYASADAVLMEELPEGDISDYLYQNGKYIYAPIPELEPSAEEQIVVLKEKLASTDYKIIKCSEAQLVGEVLPYDIAALHAERQAFRDKINELQSRGEDA